MVGWAKGKWAVGELIFFEDEDLRVGGVRGGNIGLDLDLLSFSGDDYDDVYLPGAEFLLRHLPPLAYSWSLVAS